MIDRADTEFAEAGVAHRIVISHVPFTQIERAPFDIEQGTYRPARIIPSSVAAFCWKMGLSV